MLTEFAGLSTPLVADACIRRKVPLRVAPPGIGAVIPGRQIAGRARPARHYGSVDVFLEAFSGAGYGDVLVVDNGGRADEACVGWIATAKLAHHGMVTGMASKKVTITLDEAQLERIRSLVDAGIAPSVSGFVQHAVGVSLDDVAGWGALLAEALQETGGSLSDSERAWADEALGVTQRGGRSAA